MQSPGESHNLLQQTGASHNLAGHNPRNGSPLQPCSALGAVHRPACSAKYGEARALSAGVLESIYGRNTNAVGQLLKDFSLLPCVNTRDDKRAVDLYCFKGHEKYIRWVLFPIYVYERNSYIWKEPVSNFRIQNAVMQIFSIISFFAEQLLSDDRSAGAALSYTAVAPIL